MYIQYDIYAPWCVVSQYDHKNSPLSICIIIIVSYWIVKLAVILGSIFPLMFIEISEKMYVQYDIYGTWRVVSQYDHRNSP